jgi:bifunctional aspartokinase / homoserine dehydrogenase 1
MTSADHPDTSASYRVLKFGGGAIADAGRVRRAVEIVREERASAPDVRFIVVVSAFGGITELLDQAARAAEGGSGSRAVLDRVAAKHREILGACAPVAERAVLAATMTRWTDEVRDVLVGIELVRECTPRMLDRMLALGERVSSLVMAAALRGAGIPAEAVPSEDLLLTDDTFGSARVDLERSAPRVVDRLSRVEGVPVVPGFVAATPRGETTTLGRGGADYTASLVGSMMDADRIELWTDVDGVMSADPRLVPDAFSLSRSRIGSYSSSPTSAPGSCTRRPSTLPGKGGFRSSYATRSTRSSAAPGWGSTVCPWTTDPCGASPRSPAWRSSASRVTAWSGFRVSPRGSSTPSPRAA